MKSFMNWSCVASAVVEPAVCVGAVVVVVGVLPTPETGVVMAFLSCSCEDPHVGACGLHGFVDGLGARMIRRRLPRGVALGAALLRGLAAHRLGAEVREL